MENPPFLYDIFLSHNRAQKDWTRNLARRLRDDGFRVWFDEWILPRFAGANWTQLLREGVKESRKVGLVWSPEFFSREWPQFEASIIQLLDPIGLEQRIIPLLHTDCPIPEDWRFREALDFTSCASGNIRFEFRFQQLLHNLDNSKPFEGDFERFRVHYAPSTKRPQLPSTTAVAVQEQVGETQAPNLRLRPQILRQRTAASKEMTKPADMRSIVTASTMPIAADTHTLKIALLYKRGAEPDETLLRTLEAELCADGNQVFIDRHMSIGVEWAREIERQVRTADVVIPLLSASSIRSEMLAYELQIAHEAAQQNSGKPRILPVRFQCETPLPDPIGAIVNPLQHALWTGRDDEQLFIAHLIHSLHSTIDQPVRPPDKLEAVGGAVPLDSPFYIVRPIDHDFISAIARHDSIVLVKGARQIGKTSLLARGLQQARAGGARVVLTDLQKFNTDQLKSIDSFFATLADLIADQLDLDLDPEKISNRRRGASMNFERFVRRDVLGRIDSYLVWALDEVDRLFTCSYGSEVFGLFRSWHNERALDPSGPWHQLTLAIAYATEAHLFISDLNQSPFNVGTRLALSDFTLDQLAELNRLYSSPLQSSSEIIRFHQLLGGQPYLVRRGLNEMVNHGIRLAIFERQADQDEGFFGDHLRRLLVLLAHDVELCDSLRAFISDATPLPQDYFYRLRAAGVISGDSLMDVRVRCQLYRNYLERHLLS